MRVDLYSIPSDYGRGANDGAYYPVGLLTIGTYLRLQGKVSNVSVKDLHHVAIPDIQADVVGISASSALNYAGVLEVARKAKAAGSIVVLGGPHATALSEQILRNRVGLVDYVIRGSGEVAFSALLEAIDGDREVSKVPGLTWRCGTHVQHNDGNADWRYDDYLPLDLSLIHGGVAPYWDTVQRRLDPNARAALVIFTHFGCGYRDAMIARQKNREGNWCTYCSLNDRVSRRQGQSIVHEVLGLVRANHVPSNSDVLLKCYGDNVGTQMEMLLDLQTCIEMSNAWKDYGFYWTFYSQSSRLSCQMAELLRSVGTKNLYIGFDSADDEIQRINGLGTSMVSHRKAVQNCIDFGLRIQAGFVVGCAGETIHSLDNTLRFAESLTRTSVLDRINSAVLFVVPGAPAYDLLCSKEPWIRSLDLLPTEEIQWLWVKHFCPRLGRSPSEGLEILRRYANRLDDMSPGVHASMGFVSHRLEREASTRA